MSKISEKPKIKKEEKQSVEDLKKDKEFNRSRSIISIRPTLNAAQCIKAYDSACWGNDTSSRLSEDLLELGDVLVEKVEIVQNGSLQNAEAMLMSQAYALQAMFTNLAVSSKRAEYLDTSERYLRMALKAQAQCTRTLEALGNIKASPSIATINQNTNIGQAVQINNTIHAPPMSADAAPSEEKLNSTNELLEVPHEQWLDNRTTETSITINTDLEAMEAIHGPSNCVR